MNGILKVGEPLKRFEDESLLRGEGQFVDNLDMQDQVFLHFHRGGNVKILGPAYPGCRQIALHPAEDSRPQIVSVVLLPSKFHSFSSA